MADDLGITVKKDDDTPEWYEQVCLKADVADFGEIKGTMVIKPIGFHIWESIQRFFDDTITNPIGADNCSFPLFIPERFFKKEAEHAEGFAPELAWITTAQGGEENEDKAIIRPTSETIIADQFRKWLRNYRQLPIKVNQWCNIVRWEVKQTKLFLRGREFLWQEGHCIYEKEEECERDVKWIIGKYEDLCKELLALPVILGKKTKAETFPGADYTYAIEGLMPDGKALQMGTSHHLGQGFMKVFDVTYDGRDKKQHIPFYNSWGLSTRLIGATIMVHSDDNGLVLPPGLCKKKAIVVPIVKTNNKETVEAYAHKVADKLGVTVDDRDQYTFGWKINDHELHGVPMVIIVGEKEMQDEKVMYKMRDTGEKKIVAVSDLDLDAEFAAMHQRLYDKAKSFLDSSIVECADIDALKKAIDDRKVAKVAFCGDPEAEAQIKEQTGATSRCIIDENTPGTCVITGKPTKNVVYFSKSY